MIEDSLRVSNPSGLHARSARELVELIREFDADVTFTNENTEASGESILELMMLAAHAGADLKVEIQGSDEEKAHREIKAFFQAGFQHNDTAV